MPYVIFIAAPGVEVMKNLYDYSRGTGYSTRTLTVSTTYVNSCIKLFLIPLIKKKITFIYSLYLDV